MGKRVARDLVDRDQLEQDSDEFAREEGNKADLDNDEQIAQRRMVKIKRRVTKDDQVKTSSSLFAPSAANTGGFKLFAPLGSNAANAEAKADEEKDGKDAKPAGSLFGNTASGGASTSLFGNAKPASNGGLFGNSTAEPKAGGGLFGNTGTAGGSLFGNPNPKGSLFAPTTGTGLFGGKQNTLSFLQQGGSSLFGNADKNGETKPPVGGSLFGQSNSLFGEGFGKKAEKDKNDEAANNDSDGGYQNEDEPPSVKLEDQAVQKSPFTKVFDKEVQKFKQATPVDKKRNCGVGKCSIQKGEFGEDDNKLIIFKVIFKNSLGKILYDGQISKQFSKMRKIEEKAYKNQLKVALVVQDKESKKQCVQYCLINFNRNDDLVAFEKEFNDAIKSLPVNKKTEGEESKK